MKQPAVATLNIAVRGRPSPLKPFYLGKAGRVGHWGAGEKFSTHVQQKFHWSHRPAEERQGSEELMFLTLTDVHLFQQLWEASALILVVDTRKPEIRAMTCSEPYRSKLQATSQPQVSYLQNKESNVYPSQGLWRLNEIWSCKVQAPLAAAK